MIQQIIDAATKFAADLKLGLLVIPVVFAISFALIVFAKNSYKCFRVALPLLAAFAGAYIGAGLLGPIVKDMAPDLGSACVWIPGLLVALILGGLCTKLHKLTMTLVGLGLGALAIDGLVKGILWNLDFVNNMAENAPGGKGGALVAIVGMIILAACAVVSAIILVKFFRGIYIILTSIACWVIALALPAIFIFSTTAFAEIAVIALAVIGLLFGIKTTVKQFKNAI
jgi:hypothetical protein